MKRPGRLQVCRTRVSADGRSPLVGPIGSATCAAECLEARLLLHAGHDHGNRGLPPADAPGDTGPRLLSSPFELAGTAGATAVGDPLLPDMFPLASQQDDYVYGWYLDFTEIPGRVLLRLSTAMANQGRGAMELRGGTINPDGTQDVLQRVFHEGGGFHDRLAGVFTWHEAHNHIHFDGFASYNIRARTAGNGVGDIVAAGDKVSFCLLDIDRFNGGLPGSPAGPVYQSCGQFQGISVGWADVYDSSLPDQWIDVTNVPTGQYWIEVLADPSNHLEESDETNNVVRIPITLDRGALAVSGHVPSGDLLMYGPASSIDVRFIGPVDPGSFSAEDIVSFTGPGGVDLRDSITSMTFVEPSILRVTFAQQTATGTYSLVLGPNILTAGTSRAMDQDGDGTAGEVTQDRYTANFALRTSIADNSFGYVARPADVEAIDLVFGAPGVQSLLDDADDQSAGISLGTSTFRFYGSTFSTLFASSNGLITFGSGSPSAENGSLNSVPSQRAIAVLWDDWVLDRTVADRILYRFDDLDADGTRDRLVIEWSDIFHFDTSADVRDPVTFQAILRLNTGTVPGDIVLNYVDVETADSHARGATATVGIKDNGTQGANRLLLVQNREGNIDGGRAIHIGARAAVLGRRLFYNDSALDGRDPAAGAPDDAAVAASKRALLAGAPGAANRSAYAGGINGIFLDVAALPAGAEATLGPDDFVFRTGSSGSPTGWAAAPNPSQVLIRRGQGATGADRIHLVWDDATAVKNDWLQVTLKTGDSGLGAADVFYFGSLIADANGDGSVSVADAGIVATNFGLANRSPDDGDFSGDGSVTVIDVGHLGSQFGSTLGAPTFPSLTSDAQVRTGAVAAAVARLESLSSPRARDLATGVVLSPAPAATDEAAGAVRTRKSRAVPPIAPLRRATR